jgi:DNA-binding XRE family transcriptional regulator
MYNSIELISALKSRYDLKTDYAVAQKLGVTKQSICKIRKYESQFGIPQCIKIAELLNLEPFAVIASTQYRTADRIKDEYGKTILKRYVSDSLKTG